MPDFYSGAAGLPGRFTEGFSLRRSRAIVDQAIRRPRSAAQQFKTVVKSKAVPTWHVVVAL